MPTLFVILRVLGVAMMAGSLSALVIAACCYFGGIPIVRRAGWPLR